MKLDLVTPEETIFSGEVKSVTLPGTKGSFTILSNHAPLISSLSSGTLRYVVDGNEVIYSIKGGFIEVSGDSVNVCVEEIFK